MRNAILKAAIAAAHAQSVPVAKALPKPLYVCRSVLNGMELQLWAKGQGFKSMLPLEDLHVTVCYSKAKINWQGIGDDWADRPDWGGDMGLARALGPVNRQNPWEPSDPPGSLRIRDGARTVERLGDQGAVVLKFDAPVLVSRWVRFREAGASWDYPAYSPHVTITYKAGDMDLSNVEPFTGDILLGPEDFKPLETDKKYDEEEGDED